MSQTLIEALTEHINYVLRFTLFLFQQITYYFLNTVDNGFIARSMTAAIIHQTLISISDGINAANIIPKATQLSFTRI